MYSHTEQSQFHFRKVDLHLQFYHENGFRIFLRELLDTKAILKIGVR